MQFQVCLNRSWQVATKWSDADRQRTKEQLERKFHQLTFVKCKLFDKLFQYHLQQLLQEVGTMATGPRSSFAKKLIQTRTTTEEDISGVGNMTADKHVEFQVCLSNAETEATIWSEVHMDHIVSQL